MRYAPLVPKTFPYTRLADGLVPKTFLYTRLADDLERQIRTGVYRVGEKLPSVRQLKRERGVSLATVTQALAALEIRGLVAARPRSGYFVSFPNRSLPSPPLRPLRMRPRKVPLPLLADDFVTASANKTMVPLGGAVLSPQLLPLKHLARIAKEKASLRERVFASYGAPAGAPELQRSIAKRLLKIGLGVTSEDIVVSAGCMDAIRLALLATTKPGDTVALESPTFFGFLQLVRDLGLYALEVPTDPQHGIDLPSVQTALQKHSVKAIIVTPNFQNPTGAVMPDQNKRELGKLAKRYRATIIEDDIYGDLQFGNKRPAPLASLVDCDIVYCSSFSKTLTPGLRVGYILPFVHQDKIRRLKLSGTITSPSLNQLVIAEYLQTGAYERHLRTLRVHLKNQVGAAHRALAESLPPGTQITTPKGGFLLWIRLPAPANSLELYEQMQRQGISILAGPLCTTNTRYRNSLRVSCGYPWNNKLDAAIAKIAKAVRAQLR